MTEPGWKPIKPIEGAREIIRLRRINSKTFHIKDNSDGTHTFTCRKSIAPMHYYKKNQWHDIDLNFEDKETHYEMNKSLMTVIVEKDKIKYSHRSREYGRVDVELQSIGNITEFNIKPRVSCNQIFYDQVIPGLDIKVQLGPIRTFLFKKISDDTIPKKFVWKVSEDKKSFCNLVRETNGVDADNNSTKMNNSITNEVEKTSSETGNLFNEFLFLEEWTGEVSKIIDSKTRKKEWSREVIYPVIIDTDVHENIVADNDDGSELGGGAWSANTVVFDLRGFGTRPYNPGWRFQTIPVPQGVTIDAATITVKQIADWSTPAGRLYGDDVDNAASWSNGNLPSGITKTLAFVQWTAPGGGSIGTRTFGVTNIVQEIVSRPGWASNNNMRFGLLVTSASYSMITFADYPVAGCATLDITYTGLGGGAILTTNSKFWGGFP